MKTVVIGLLGTTLDRAREGDRWSQWRPSVSLCQHEDLLVDRFELLFPAKARPLAEVVMADIRGDDTLRVELEIEDATVTDTRRPLVERGETLAARALARTYFLQMKGTARISGRVAGARVSGEGAGFFETYR